MASMERSGSSSTENCNPTNVETCDCSLEIKYAISRSRDNPWKKYKKPGNKWCKRFEWLDSVKTDDNLMDLHEALMRGMLYLKLACVMLLIIIVLLVAVVLSLEKQYQMLSMG